MFDGVCVVDFAWIYMEHMNECSLYNAIKSSIRGSSNPVK